MWQPATLLVVSHDVAAMESYCSRAAKLEEGRLVDEGPVSEITARYRADVERRQGEKDAAADGGHVGVA